MIVHYNPETFTITGICAKLLESVADPYIETEDPIAEQIFLAKEKIYHYRVEVIDQVQHIGKLVKQVQTSSAGNNRLPINSYYYRIPVVSKDTDFTVIQNTKNKTINFSLTDRAFAKWIGNHSVPLLILACVPDDPYTMLWSLTLTPLNVGDQITYTGQDNICFYTKKLFESYHYVIT